MTLRSKSFIFQTLLSQKQIELSHTLLLNTNGKSNVGGSNVLLDLICSDPESSRFKVTDISKLVSRKRYISEEVGLFILVFLAFFCL